MDNDKVGSCKAPSVPPGNDLRMTRGGCSTADLWCSLFRVYYKGIYLAAVVSVPRDCEMLQPICAIDGVFTNRQRFAAKQTANPEVLMEIQ